MSVRFLFVVILRTILVLVLLAVVEIPQGGNTFRGLYLIVTHELAVVEGNQG